MSLLVTKVSIKNPTGERLLGVDEWFAYDLATRIRLLTSGRVTFLNDDGPVAFHEVKDWLKSQRPVEPDLAAHHADDTHSLRR